MGVGGGARAWGVCVCVEERKLYCKALQHAGLRIVLQPCDPVWREWPCSCGVQLPEPLRPTGVRLADICVMPL